MQATEALYELFDINDVHSTGYLTLEQVHQLYNEIRIGGVSFSQVAASMEYVCGNCSYITAEELNALLQELDRRYYLLQDLQWEFALLDNQHNGRISIEKARFLFLSVHGKLFSSRRWRRFLHSRPLSDAPLSFQEIEVDLCNIPTPEDWDVGGRDVNDDIISYGRGSLEKIKLPRREKGKRKNDTEVTGTVQRSPQQAQMRTNTAEVSSQLADRSNDKDAERERKKKEADLRKKEEADEELRKKKETEARRNEEMMEQKKAEKKLRQKEEKKAEKERKRREKKQAASEEHHRAAEKLEAAIESRDQEKLEPEITEYKANVTEKHRDDELLTRAQRMLDMLKCAEGLKGAVSRRIVAELETAVNNARKGGFDRSEELAREVANADELMLRLRRLEKLRSEVLELKQSTIAELRSYQKPMTIIHKVMTATYLVLGTPEKDTKKWTAVQSLLGKTGRDGLKRRIGKCDPADISVTTATRARALVGEADLEAIRDVSAGAATFFVWVDGMIEEVTEREEMKKI